FHLKKSIWRFSKILRKINVNSTRPKIRLSDFNIAVQFTEGLDLARRSDLVWFPKSQIDPSRVIIYFDGSFSRPVTSETLEKIEELGMNWICLNKDLIAVKNVPIWDCPAQQKNAALELLDITPTNAIEKWIYQQSCELVKEVAYWAAFYKDFNIKLNLVVGEGDLKYIAQSIAFDYCDTNDGFLVGKQRSDLFLPVEDLLAHHTNDIFFTWSSRSRKYLPPNLNKIKSNVVVGYPYDLAFKNRCKDGKNTQNDIRAKGAKFIVALFDNMHGPHLQFSSKMMEKFYNVFLDWLFEDEEVGLIIKSKKPLALNLLPEILQTLTKAESTGRCVRLKNEAGRLPSDASEISDVAVGIGISTSVVEAAIAGHRSMHCDLTCLWSHEYYLWGYERIIFDDIDRMMKAIKAYKKDKRSNPTLGDWGPFLDQLDPFRDGCAGERMGTYLRWLLEGFDQNRESEAILLAANEQYVQKWGGKLVFEKEKALKC
ncbi:hypothetical protein KKB18_11400, partial [bacterium]|nr:hypothetical protein [bacterium]